MRSRCEGREISRGFTKDEVELWLYALADSYPEKTHGTPQHHSLNSIKSQQLTGAYKEGIKRKPKKCFIVYKYLIFHKFIYTTPSLFRVVSCDDPYPPRIGLRSHARVDQMRSVSPEAIAGVRW